MHLQKLNSWLYRGSNGKGFRKTSISHQLTVQPYYQDWVTPVFLSWKKGSSRQREVTPGCPFTRRCPRRSPSPHQAEKLAAGQGLPRRESGKYDASKTGRPVKGCPVKASVLSLDRTGAPSLSQVISVSLSGEFHSCLIKV